MHRQLTEALGVVATAGGYEARHCFTRLRSEDESGFCFESSDPTLLEAALPRLRDVAGDRTVRGRLLPAQALVGRSAWVAASVAEVRREPAHTAEQVTQALQGEVLEPLLHEDGWVLVRLPDQYVGWVRDWHVGVVLANVPEEFTRRANARVASTVAALASSPEQGADPLGETILGTRVVVSRKQHGWAAVELPGARSGYLPEAALRDGAGPWTGGIASLLAMLRRFLGVPYLWGGKSPKGFDCSGLVQFAFALHGLQLPRDADEQAQCGLAVDAPEPGDLHFFGKERVTHVAVAETPRRFLHARGEVRVNALRPGDPGYDAELHALWRGTRRVFQPAPAV
jgi:cell wall-associated NlpC family hydrolase